MDGSQAAATTLASRVAARAARIEEQAAALARLDISRREPLPGQLALDLGEPPPAADSGPARPEPGEVTINVEVLKDARLHHADVVVLLAVVACAGGGAGCDASDELLSGMVHNISGKAIARSLERLQAAGHVAVEQEGEGRTIVLAWRTPAS